MAGGVKDLEPRVPAEIDFVIPHRVEHIGLVVIIWVHSPARHVDPLGIAQGVRNPAKEPVRGRLSQEKLDASGVSGSRIEIFQSWGAVGTGHDQTGKIFFISLHPEYETRLIQFLFKTQNTGDGLL